MTPTKSSYKIDTSKTGFHSTDDYVNSTQTINPQELNLWRVISLNDDGTIDVISEKISSIRVWFCGKTGYINYVQYLRELISAYSTEYTVDFRPFGYNGQTEYITDTSRFNDLAPWECSTGESCNPVESQGGGDELYTKDYNLVKSVLGTTVASKPDGTKYSYWMVSRYYDYSSTTDYYWYGRVVDTLGDVHRNILYYYEDSSFSSDSNHDSLRPILTLKSGLKYTGVGTENYPMEIHGS